MKNLWLILLLVFSPSLLFAWGVMGVSGGIGGAHPYKSSVSIPSYVGATNPEDNAWVAGVLALDATYMKSASGDPGWIEGACAECSHIGGNSSFTIGGNSTITFK